MRWIALEMANFEFFTTFLGEEMQSFRMLVAASLVIGGAGGSAAEGAFAVFSTGADSDVRTLDITGGSVVQGTLVAGQTVSNAVGSDGHVLFSINSAVATYNADPSTATYTTYSGASSLGFVAAAATGTAIGNLIDSSNVSHFYRLDLAGATYVSGDPIVAGAVSDGKALISLASARYTYDVNTNTLVGIGSSVTNITAAGDSKRFATDLFGKTYIVDDSFGTVSMLGSPQLRRAFGSKDLLLIDMAGVSNKFLYDTRTDSSSVIGSGTDIFAVAAGNSNYIFYSIDGGSTAWEDPDGNTSGTFSSQQLVSGFSFGDYAVLGLRDADGSSGRTIVMNNQGQFLAQIASSTGNDSAAYVTGAGVVPEPSSLMVLALGGLLLRRRRR